LEHGAEHVFGYQSNEIIGQHFSRFFAPDDIFTGQPEHELKISHSLYRTLCREKRESAVGFSTAENPVRLTRHSFRRDPR